MDEQKESPRTGIGPLRAPRTPEQIAEGAARFRRAVAEGRRWHEEQMREDNPDPQGRISLLVPLSSNPAPTLPAAPPPTEGGTDESLALFGDVAPRVSMTVGPNPHRSSDETEGDIFDRALGCHRTGDDIADLSEISRVLAAIDHFSDTIGPSDTLAAAREYLFNITGQIVMARLTGHEAPYVWLEHEEKRTLRDDIAAGRRQPELSKPLDVYDEERERLWREGFR